MPVLTNLTLHSVISFITTAIKSIYFICTVTMETRVALAIINVLLTVSTIITRSAYTSVFNFRDINASALSRARS